MEQLFKIKDIVRVTLQGSAHYNKLGEVDCFITAYEGGPTMYTIDFADGSVGSIMEENLEYFDGKLLKAIVPNPTKHVNDIWVEEINGIQNVYTSGKIIFNTPPKYLKECGARLQFYPIKPVNDTVWIRKDGNTVFIHCPGEVKSMKPIPMPEGVSVVSFSPICK